MMDTNIIECIRKYIRDEYAHQGLIGISDLAEYCHQIEGEIYVNLLALKTIGVNHYKVLLTIIPPKPTKDGEEAREFLTDAGIPLFKHGIRRLIVFQRAALQGVPVYEVSDRSSRNAWNDYVAVGKELING